MKQNTYIPKPVDTSDVQLPEELEMLVEQMSKNVHDVWAHKITTLPKNNKTN